eukprot:TRINITY_DN4987_c0_g2_i2.p1 TRINITY_DN4987_c0_g2~~TRINITY_DN4987_c0_g2_i2.p1  ORF type:complete len:303 (+),score=83.77 TRINITY_DN4987_c0_g2_i2:120-911(+)
MNREEEEHFKRIVLSFANYGTDSNRWVDHLQVNWLRLNESQRRLLPSMESKFTSLRSKIEINSKFIKNFIKDERVFLNKDMKEYFQMSFDEKRGSPLERDFEKVRSTLRQFVRDWSEEGAAERKQSYDPILSEIERMFGSCERKWEIKILVPGAGLGRLSFEIVRRGFSCEGNEFSYHMLLASNFVLNQTSKVNEYRFHPFIHQSLNVVNEEDQLRSISIPDVVPTQVLKNSKSEYSMSAGEFIESYQSQIGKLSCFAVHFME